ncbi:MAG: polyhydroxyalkanoate depolymerase [Alphaproteobacteria bacterium]
MAENAGEEADIVGLCAALETGADQPARRAFRIDHVVVGGRGVPVEQVDLLCQPFCVLTHLRKSTMTSQRRVLIIPPLSGHFPFLMNDLILTLLPDHDVFVADWINARYVATHAGSFGLADSIQTVMAFIRALDSEVTVIAVCQATVSALAATALLSQSAPSHAPEALVLIAGPIDPLMNGTPITRLIKSHTLSWYENFALADVPAPRPGADRRVYPAATQLGGLVAYLQRQVAARGELYFKLTADDGAAPHRFPFYEAYTALMDLPAEVFLDTIRYVFHERALPRRTLTWRDVPVACEAVTRTALMTIEGGRDDVAAPGQTFAAHKLCPNIPFTDRASLVLDPCGHFSTFHGRHMRSRVTPAIRAFLASRSA